MYERIIVAYDGSTQAQKAFGHALQPAKAFQSEVLVVSVFRPPEPATRVELDAVIDEARQKLEAAFAGLRTAGQQAGVRIRTEVMVGHPAEQIIVAAEQESAGLIAMGRRGKGTFGRWLMGSVSEKVLRYAHCAVLVVQ